MKLIIGFNGFIRVQVIDPGMMDNHKDDEMISSSSTKEQAILLSRLHKAYAEWGMGNAIRVLSNLGFTVTLEVIMETVNLSNSKNIDTHDMLGSEFHVVVSENEAERRREKRKK
uniref:Uncharacterized protein n=1 Tax=Brassica campestris TaxID=3711 RepID=M4EP11_BRACM